MKIKIIFMIFAFSILSFVPVARAELCGGTITIQVNPSSGIGAYSDPEPTDPDSDPQPSYQ